MDKYKTLYSQIGVKGFKQIAKDYGVSDDMPFVKKYVEVGDKVLDLGCGYGRVTIPMYKAGINVVGIDLETELIKEAKRESRKQGLSIKFDIGDMTKLPYKAYSFHKIFCLWNTFAELLTLDKQIKALCEIHRVLKDGGQALLVLPNGDGQRLKKRLKKCNDGRISSMILEGAQEKQYIHDKKSFRLLLTKTLFQNYEIRHINIHNRRRMLVTLTK